MASIQLTERPGLVLVAAIVLHVVLISAQVNTRGGIPMLHVATFGVFAEVQRGTMNMIGGVQGVWTGYIDLRNAHKENQELKQNLQMMQVQLQEARALAQRSESLRQLLELRQRAGVQTTATEVIGGPADPDFRTMTIDKGSADGLKPDMAVISPAGVVGRVIRPTPRASMVQLLIDRNAAAGALIERTRAQGIVVGQGTDTLRMEYVPATADVKQGDIVITSGIDKIYPKGFVIGMVAEVDRGAGSYRTIVIKPTVDFSRLEELLVVLTPPPAYVPEEPPVSAPAAQGNVSPTAPGATVAPGPARNTTSTRPIVRPAPPRETAPAPPPGNATPPPRGNTTPGGPRE